VAHPPPVPVVDYDGVQRAPITLTYSNCNTMALHATLCDSSLLPGANPIHVAQVQRHAANDTTSGAGRGALPVVEQKPMLEPPCWVGGFGADGAARSLQLYCSNVIKSVCKSLCRDLLRRHPDVPEHVLDRVVVRLRNLGARAGPALALVLVPLRHPRERRR